jgi:hypothetical protein
MFFALPAVAKEGCKKTGHLFLYQVEGSNEHCIAHNLPISR